ncbi:hypothetical protein NEILACOT_04486 [Neisseria lactamica ATCC 23970]|uniref:Uncharacterized protein n=1 Tax=Neisseria lactamica ATCC 23970 TaxID=546265 RepID=D0WAB6_NEILA|nr:hypothetical protein NEILACOT_04486 [Neisseria lactamica ATCC 23970]
MSPTAVSCMKKSVKMDIDRYYSLTDLEDTDKNRTSKRILAV